MLSIVEQRHSWLTLKVLSFLDPENFALTLVFLDSSSPTFANMVNGQVNLRDAIRREIDFESGGKSYKLSEKPAVLIVR